MKKITRQRGFSLVETVIALGVLTVGMMFIAAVFPVGIYLTNLSIERTTASVASDEAFAKIQLYAQTADSNQSITLCVIEIDEMKDFNDWFYSLSLGPGYEINQNDFTYPSIQSDNDEGKRYYWSALCRRLVIDCTGPDRTVQVTVFVSKKVGASSKYYNQDFSGLADFPVPVKIGVNAGPQRNELQINAGYIYLISDGYTIVDDATGEIYRVLEKYAAPNDDTILLDKDFDWTGSNGDIWVVPPPYRPSATSERMVGGRYPCIGVYQKIIRF